MPRKIPAKVKKVHPRMSLKTYNKIYKYVADVRKDIIKNLTDIKDPGGRKVRKEMQQGNKGDYDIDDILVMELADHLSSEIIKFDVKRAIYRRSDYFII